MNLALWFAACFFFGAGYFELALIFFILGVLFA